MAQVSLPERGAVVPFAISPLLLAPARKVVGCFGVRGSVFFRLRHLLFELRFRRTVKKASWVARVQNTVLSEAGR